MCPHCASPREEGGGHEPKDLGEKHCRCVPRENKKNRFCSARGGHTVFTCPRPSPLGDGPALVHGFIEHPIVLTSASVESSTDESNSTEEQRDTSSEEITTTSAESSCNVLKYLFENY